MKTIILTFLISLFAVSVFAGQAQYTVDADDADDVALGRSLPAGTTKAQLVQSLLKTRIRELKRQQAAEDVQAIRALIEFTTDEAKEDARDALVAGVTVPSVTNPGAQTSNYNDAVSLQITASDVDGQALIYTATGLPEGLTINSTTGLITGVVITPAVSSVDVIVTKLSYVVTTINFAWTVN
jgi:hypothetical protein